ncbi:MAG TPA: LuxR C-terminal-related transcriptional regulator, partial [Streptosporangiaceae bacterium]|nr:LuxR C-terminal-related transcriptional regulator [Streptosporangiaceae bacterium]
LSTHLSFPEIAAEMFLSRNTVKSHTNSIYRKLGTSTRSQAVARSRELGLLQELPRLSPHQGVGTHPGARWTGA